MTTVGLRVFVLLFIVVAVVVVAAVFVSLHVCVRVCVYISWLAGSARIQCIDECFGATICLLYPLWPLRPRDGDAPVRAASCTKLAGSGGGGRGGRMRA